MQSLYKRARKVAKFMSNGELVDTINNTYSKSIRNAMQDELDSRN